jgi:hypothetical protein
MISMMKLQEGYISKFMLLLSLVSYRVSALKNITHTHIGGWCSGNALDLYLRGAWFESQPTAKGRRRVSM